MNYLQLSRFSADFQLGIVGNIFHKCTLSDVGKASHQQGKWVLLICGVALLKYTLVPVDPPARELGRTWFATKTGH